MMQRGICALFAWALILSLAAQQPAKAPAPSALAALDFLLGTWSAQTTGGAAGVQSAGTYTFRRDLAGHALQRASSTDSCSGPQSFDCQHHDQLTIFEDPAKPHGASLYALYLDSEGHVIYYVVTTPSPDTVLFTSQAPAGAPHFHLSYHLQGTGPNAVMHGFFEGAAPGSDTFHPYLEWTGTRQPRT